MLRPSRAGEISPPRPSRTSRAQTSRRRDPLLDHGRLLRRRLTDGAERLHERLHAFLLEFVGDLLDRDTDLAQLLEDADRFFVVLVHGTADDAVVAERID